MIGNPNRKPQNASLHPVFCFFGALLLIFEMAPKDERKSAVKMTYGQGVKKLWDCNNEETTHKRHKGYRTGDAFLILRSDNRMSMIAGAVVLEVQ